VRSTSRHTLGVLGIAALAACQDPTGFDASQKTTAPEASGDGGADALASDAPENCAASDEWLPVTPPLDMFNPLPHPASECPFYRGGWQAFLHALQPDDKGVPAIVSYPTLDDIFVSRKPHATRNTAQRSWLGGIKQAGGRQILIDQDGHAIYYGIHVNQAFADFVAQNGLRTLAGVQNADPTLFFPSGVVELKSAWKDISGKPGAYGSYVTTDAWVPTLHQDPTTHLVIEDWDTPRLVKVALVALHVVFTLPGHPEFIWTSFEHVDAQGTPDVAPMAADNPVLADPNNLKNTSVVGHADMVLYRGGTVAQKGNQPESETDLRLDEATQTFPGQQTSIYRMFPGSKSNSIDPDDAVTALNHNVRALFAKKAPGDIRMNYRLVGGTWMDKPELFRANSSFQNDDTNPLLGGADSTGVSQGDDRNAFLAGGGKPAQDLLENGADSPFSILAGEDRMSSTAMESFTQSPASFFNCFSCHNTQAVTSRGVPVDKDSAGKKLLDPKLINISHVFSTFVLEETQ
jgi:hypothetical protein